MTRHFSLCQLSRLIGYALTGQPVMACTLAHRHARWLEIALDALFVRIEYADYHCARMAADDERLERIRGRHG